MKSAVGDEKSGWKFFSVADEVEVELEDAISSRLSRRLEGEMVVVSEQLVLAVLRLMATRNHVHTL